MNALARFARTWPMLSALGAGLVFLALAAGAAGVAGIALAAVGVAALGWGVLSLRAGAPLVPRAVLGLTAALLVAVGAFVGVGLAESTDVAVGPLVAASVFTAVAGGHSAVLVRRGARAALPARAARSAHAATDAAGDAVAGSTSLVGLVAGALLVAALATPALAATEAGELAVPHGQHGGNSSVTDVDPDEDGHHH